MTDTVDPEVLRQARAGLSAAAQHMMQKEPFLGYLLRETPMVLTPKEESISTDGQRIYINPEWVPQFVSHRATLSAAMAHVLLHAAFGHAHRRGERDEKKWEVVTDLVVNSQLEAAYTHATIDDANGFLTFRNPHLVWSSQPSANMTAEDLYAILVNKPQEQQPQNRGSTAQGAGKCSGSPSDEPGEPGEGEGDGDGDGEGQSDRDREREALSKVARAMAQAKKEGRGSPMAELIFDHLTRSKTDWRDMLRKFLGEGSMVEPTYARPNRRYIAEGDYFPGNTRVGQSDVVVVIDTSGSIDENLGKTFVAEVAKINEDLQPDAIHVIACDDRVQWTESFGPYDNVEAKFKGRGGTRFAPAFKWVEEQGIRPKALVYFTDLYCSDYGKNPGYDVLWVVWPGGAEGPVPFGDILRMSHG